MKAIAVCASPRKDWNTESLCTAALEGAVRAGAEVELVRLYDYAFKGCVSCLACRRKESGRMLLCAQRDELTPVLQKCLAADVIILASPIFFDDVTGAMRCFLERFLFPLGTYSNDLSGRRIRKLEHGKRILMLYTMNVTRSAMEQRYQPFMSALEGRLRELFGTCNAYAACDTLQFKDYGLYEANIFDPAHKRAVHERDFPADCEAVRNVAFRLTRETDQP